MRTALAVAFIALLPAVAMAQPQPPNPTNTALDDAQRPDKHIGTTAASPPVVVSSQPSPTTDPTADTQRMGPGFQGQPHGRSGLPKTVPLN